MKKKLLELLATKNERKAAINAKVEASQDVAELRSLNAELDSLNADIRSLQDMIDALPDDPTQPNQAERTAAVNGEIPGMVSAGANGPEQRKAADDDTEFRTAFMDFVTRGTPIPVELRADANTLTTDVASVVPTVLVNRIIEKLESIGMILPLITRTNFPAGVKYPTSAVKPVAVWTTEGSGSDKQKKTTSYISFTNFKLRCEISMSMEVGTMALAAFETAFIRQVSEAMAKKIEATIISDADGTTSPKGILAETPATGQALTAKVIDYELLINAEAAIPQAYEGEAKWCMTKKTFMGFVGMTDANGQPIARITYGIGGKPERTLLGREVVLCGDYLDSFSSTLASGTIFAFIFNFSDYTLNTIYDMGIQRKQDWDTEDLLTKAVMSVDGKVVDKNSLVTIAKAA